MHGRFLIIGLSLVAQVHANELAQVDKLLDGLIERTFKASSTNDVSLEGSAFEKKPGYVMRSLSSIPLPEAYQRCEQPVFDGSIYVDFLNTTLGKITQALRSIKATDAHSSLRSPLMRAPKLMRPVHTSSGDTDGWKMSRLGDTELPQRIRRPDTSKDKTLVDKVSQAAGEIALGITSAFADGIVKRPDREREEATAIESAVRRMERDMSVLDLQAGAKPQLSRTELGVLTSTVGVAAAAPWFFGEKVVEVLVPGMGALAAVIGFNAEYTGKISVARGKEIAAATLQASAEAERYLCQAERAKAIIPLCVGISATAAAIALVVPKFAGELAANGFGATLITELYLICPIFAGLSAAVAALAASETRGLSSVAMGVGSRRFASYGDPNLESWESASEQIRKSVRRSGLKFSEFSIGVLPSPLLAILTPGDISFKAIVAAAVAAAQAAFSLTQAEYKLAAAVESVALKSRSAGLADVYANQGARAASILPFTSALGGLCAATTVAVVELLPAVPGVLGETVLCSIFPALGALFAGAASIGKACAELDAEAASAASTLLKDSNLDESDTQNPITETAGLISLTFRAVRGQWKKLIKWLTELSSFFNQNSKTGPTGEDPPVGFSA